MLNPLPLAFILAAYGLGSISSAVLVCRLFQLPDPRSQGSQNPGATNVLRLGGRLPAVLTLLGDFLKGLLPTLLAFSLKFDDLVVSGVMLAAFLGHLYPIFFRFKGGKGVATAFGAWFGLSWEIGLVLAALWGFTVWITRISSVGALVAAFCAPWIIAFFFSFTLFVPMALLSALLIWRHRSNIQRLLRREEGKIL